MLAHLLLRSQARCVERLGLEDRVTFLGFIRDADLVSLYRLADVFVIPSEADLQSLTTMEAMACGLPILAANAYALPELVHHEENGFLFQPRNSDECAQYLDTLLTNPALRAQMGQKSLETIARHDRLQVLDKWEVLYQRLSSEFVEARRSGARSIWPLRFFYPPQRRLKSRATRRSISQRS